ncbi:hypothetical protein BO86DRAFT_409441 [Aspergillus japonicus CBS 114.51]|uniref:Uncharacterized protein n=1 Tax=Aspergillus japonicus CBS 114.51 TaxID=1448312 RepID=A0A8T8X2M5_ASPJA|nr:hypothetical protein BO86DRAFT_409441 [Aspergillus japonicus CBS 114.51]RAH82388.1 hypothetical protein BO86DRAFT_409441 [Aspergillus japonicus CBS 114.51]
MYVDIPRILMVMFALVLAVVEAQDTQCSAQRCYRGCVDESDECVEYCQKTASRMRNRRNAGVFWQQCFLGCDKEIKGCFKGCDAACPRRVEGPLETCNNNCLQTALGGVDRCFNGTAPRDDCLAANQENWQSCEEDCRDEAPQTQAPATPATTSAPAADSPPPAPTETPFESAIGCGEFDRYLNVYGACLAPCFFNLCLNGEKCSGEAGKCGLASECEAANKQCTSDGVKTYESCLKRLYEGILARSALIAGAGSGIPTPHGRRNIIYLSSIAGEMALLALPFYAVVEVVVQ